MSKSTQSEIEQLLSTRNIVGPGLGGEQLVFPLLVPAPVLPTTPPEDVIQEVWAEEDTHKDEVVLNDEYLCSEQAEEQPSLELVLGEEPSFPDLDNELLNLLSEDNKYLPDDNWDHMAESHPSSSTDDGISSDGSLNDERLPEWDLDDLLPPISKKPSIAESPPVHLPPTQTAVQLHAAPSSTYYPSVPPPAVQQPSTLPASSDIMVKLSVPGQPNLSVTLERDKLLEMPADRFNHLLDRSGLSENDMAYMKEWRRKGKNKMAAQLARKRKREEVDDMAAEVDSLKEELAMLKEEQRSLQVELEHYPRECRRLEHVILTNYRDHHDNSVTPDTHQIVLLSDTVLIAPVVQ